MMNFHKLISNKITRNAGWIIFGRIIQLLISLFVGIFSTRYLGPSNYGLINYASAYTAFFMSLCSLGINSVIVKELVDTPDQEGQILGTAMGLKGISSVVAAIMMISISAVLDGDEPTTVLIVALCSIGPIFNVLETLIYWFQSKLMSKLSSIAILVGYVVTSIYKVFLLISGAGVEGFAVATSIDYLCVGILLVFLYKKEKGSNFSFSWSYGIRLLKKSSPFILPALMVSIYSQTDKLMLKHMISDMEIGYYSTAVSLCGMWCFVLTAIIDSFAPSIFEAHQINATEFEKKNMLLYAIIFYLSIVVSLFFTFGADLIINILYGADFAPTAASLRVITWYTAFSYLGVARNPWIVCKNKQKYLIYVYAAAAVSNIILNLILIPLWGAVGAAWASLIAQIITTIVAPFFIKPLKENASLIIKAIMFKGIIKRIK